MEDGGRERERGEKGLNKERQISSFSLGGTKKRARRVHTIHVACPFKQYYHCSSMIMYSIYLI